MWNCLLLASLGNLTSWQKRGKVCEFGATWPWNLLNTLLSYTGSHGDLTTLPRISFITILWQFYFNFRHALWQSQLALAESESLMEKHPSKANLKIKLGQFHYIQTAAIPFNPHTIWHLDSSWLDMVVIELKQLQVSFWSWTFCNSTHLDHETDVKVIRPACSSSACNMACNHLATRHDSIMDHWTSCWPTNRWFLILHGWIHVFWTFSGG